MGLCFLSIHFSSVTYGFHSAFVGLCRTYFMSWFSFCTWLYSTLQNHFETNFSFQPVVMRRPLFLLPLARREIETDDLCECNEETGCWISPQMKSIMGTLHLFRNEKSCRVGTWGSPEYFLLEPPVPHCSLLVCWDLKLVFTVLINVYYQCLEKCFSVFTCLWKI